MVSFANSDRAALIQLEELRKQIAVGFKKRDNTYLKSIFDQYKDKASDSILKPNLRNVLEMLDITVQDEDIDQLFFLMDRNDDHRIDFEEFKRAVHKPTPLEQWAQTVPLAQLLADSIPRKPGCDPLKVVGNLTNDDIEVLSTAFLEGFKSMLAECIQRLRKAFEAQEFFAKQASNQMSAKFEVCCLSCGRITDFHKGLSGRVGAPHMDFFKAMEAEHCVKAGCNDIFTSGNYQISFSPKQEWEIIVCGKSNLADMRHSRKLPILADLISSEQAQDANLVNYEIIALVLYTGPMYMLYNGILRQFPKEHFQRFQDGGNLFSSTIHALVSAVQKIARVTRLPSGLLLYRGLGGTVELPDFFFKGDDQGCRGFADWGFMSTTSSKAVAMQYSGVKEGKPLATVLEIRVGAVDRGACVRFFSQYPGEVEYLWVPCSFLEPVGVQYLEVTADGVVTVIPIRVNANLKALTTDELVKQKRKMHLTALRYMLDEVQRDLWDEAHGSDAAGRAARDPSHQFFSQADGRPYTWEGFVQRIVAQCEETYARHKAVPATDYLNDERYRGLVSDMLDCKDMALSKLRWWLEDETQYLRPNWDEPLRAAHRGRLAFLHRTLPAPAAADNKAEDGGCGDSAHSKAEDRGCGDSDHDDIASNAHGGVNGGVVSGHEADGSDNGTSDSDGSGGSGGGGHDAVAGGVGISNPDGTGGTSGSDDRSVVEAARREAAARLCKLKGLMLADVEETNEIGETRILAAAADGWSLGNVKLLMDASADVGARDENGETAVFKAARYGHADLITLLVARRADARAVDTLRRSTALHKAAMNDQGECVRALVAAGADLDARTQDLRTPLHVAVWLGQLSAMRALLDARADVAAADNERVAGVARGTSLHQAAFRGNPEVIRMLLDGRADVRCRNLVLDTPLHAAAAKHADGRVAAQLLAAGADVNARNGDGKTPLDVACEGVRDFLRRHGGLPGPDVPECTQFAVVL